MKPLTRAELESLMERRSDPCVSIYAPMVQAGLETQQNAIRFKNMIRQAGEALEARGFGSRQAEELLAPAAALIDDIDFWQHQSTGLAAFVAEGFFRYYRVPIEVRELAVVEDRFHLKPLLPLLSGDGRFYVLALSQKEVRLLEATRHSVREIDLGDLPTSLNDALGYEVEETHLQFHTGTRTSTRTDPSRVPIYHGHGGGEDDAKEEIHKFFNLLDNGVSTLLEDRDAPLVLAGVDFLMPIYRQVTGHGFVVDGGVAGNPAKLSAEELREKAWPLVEPSFTEAQETASAKFRDLLGTGQASQQLDDVVTAAFDGRVETLFVALGTRRWGTFDPATRKVELSDQNGPGTEDLVDYAALVTLAKGGQVFAVPPEKVPEGGALAAVYRY